MSPDEEPNGIIEFYSNNQEMICYHGERMWDSMKIFGIIFPSITGVLTLFIEYLIQQEIILFGKQISALFLIPITFTAIFWFNSYREYLRFLEFSLMSWRAEKMLKFHETIPELGNKTLVIKRFLKKPHSKPKFGTSFWISFCPFI